MQKFLQNPYPPPKPPTWKNHQSHIKNQPKKIIKPPTQKNHQTHDNQRIQANQQPPLSGVRNATTTNLRENPLSSTQVKIINEPNRPKEDQKQTNQSTHTNNKPITTNETKPIHNHHRLEFTTPRHQPPIHFSQHPPARLQIFPIIFSASRPHGLHNQNLEDQPLICSLVVEIGYKVLSEYEIFRLEKA